MDLVIILSTKAVTGVISFACGIVFGSLIGAIWLRLCALWLGFGDIKYLAAFKSTLIANFVVFTLIYSVVASHGILVVLLGRANAAMQSRPADFIFTIVNYSPVFFLTATIFGLIITAVIFCRTLQHPEVNSRVKFGDSLALTSLYFAPTFGVMLILGTAVFLTVTGLLQTSGV